MSEKFEAKGTPYREGAEDMLHESYGMVGFNRISCGGAPRRMFGSSLRDHQTIVRLEVKAGQRTHDLSRDWYGSAHGRSFITVDLTAAQFAELLTTMNVGDGVPCTIVRLDGKSVEEPPDEPLEVEKVRTGFKKHASKLAVKMGVFRDEVKSLFESRKSVSKQDRTEIVKQIDLLIQEVRSNMPYVLDQFEEASEKVVTAAKAEVEAFVMHAVVTTGLNILAEGKGPKALTDGLPRTPDGRVDNCSLANGEREGDCQVCGGACPDRSRYEEDG